MAIATASYDALKGQCAIQQGQGRHGRDRQSGVKRLQHEQHLGPLTFSAMPPVWTANNELSQWPVGPMSWLVLQLGRLVGVWISGHSGNPAQGQQYFAMGYCLDTLGGAGSCQVADPIFGGSTAQDLVTLKTHTAYCNE